MSTITNSDGTVALPELLNVKQVAAYLGLHRVTVLQFAREGKLPGLKIGRGWRFRADEIRDWLETQRQQSELSPAFQLDPLWNDIRQQVEAGGCSVEDVPRLIEQMRHRAAGASDAPATAEQS